MCQKGTNFALAVRRTENIPIMRVSRNMIITGIVLIVLLLLWGVWSLVPHRVIETAPPPAVTHSGDLLRIRPGGPLDGQLTVEPVAETLSPHQVELPAQIIASPGQSVDIHSPVVGRVANLYVQTGQHVQKGDVLAILYSGDLAQAWSDDRKAQATLTLTRLAYRRAVGVLNAGGNAVKDMQSARNDLEQAQAEATRAHLRLQALGTDGNAGYQPLVAPVSGIVTAISTGIGQNVTDMTATLMNVANLDTVWIQASLPESLLPMLGASMTLEASFPGQTCHGPVTSLDGTVHTDTRRLNLYLRCNNTQGALRPGQFTTATLNITQQAQPLLPKTALLMDNDQVSVFVETAPNTYRRRFITISYEEGESVRILSGLKAGERIITHGAILLNDY